MEKPLFVHTRFGLRLVSMTVLSDFLDSSSLCLLCQQLSPHTHSQASCVSCSACHSRRPVSYHLDINLYETLEWHQHFCAIVLDQPVAKKSKDGVQRWEKGHGDAYPAHFRFFQSKSRILVWLYEQTQMKIEGNIIGFDEYMNVVLEDACEIDTKQIAKNHWAK